MAGKKDLAGSVVTEDQAHKFIKTSRELGCDEDEAKFREKLKKIAKPTKTPIPKKDD